LDASVALAWFLDSPVPAYAVQVKQALLKGAKGVVPALWHLEIANSLVVAERRKLLSAADAQIALSSLEQVALQALELHADTVPMREAFTTARSFALSAYDSVYLNLARAEGIPLATLDKGLRTAASKAGVELFP
jgi:predicted nucleic acid-binding protein